MSQSSQTHNVTLPDGACLKVFEQGVGTPLLLISGLGGAAAYWNPCLPALAAAHRVHHERNAAPYGMLAPLRAQTGRRPPHQRL